MYVPHLFSTYATRYGVIGAVFAMISAFFCVMVVVVGSAAAGREVHDELDRIRRGERPAEDEVRRQWDEVTARRGRGGRRCGCRSRRAVDERDVSDGTQPPAEATESLHFGASALIWSAASLSASSTFSAFGTSPRISSIDLAQAAAASALASS